MQWWHVQSARLHVSREHTQRFIPGLAPGPVVQPFGSLQHWEITPIPYFKTFLFGYSLLNARPKINHSSAQA